MVSRNSTQRFLPPSQAAAALRSEPRPGRQAQHRWARRLRIRKAHLRPTVGPDGATPAQVRQAVNGATLPTTGAGIKVGVMSTSFNNLGGAATDEMDGALPPAANIQVLKDLASGG